MNRPTNPFYLHCHYNNEGMPFQPMMGGNQLYHGMPGVHIPIPQVPLAHQMHHGFIENRIPDESSYHKKMEEANMYVPAFSEVSSSLSNGSMEDYSNMLNFNNNARDGGEVSHRQFVASNNKFNNMFEMYTNCPMKINSSSGSNSSKTSSSKRLARNYREQRRAQQISSAITNLREILVHASFPVRSDNKVDTLSGCKSYIEHLQAKIQRMQRKLKKVSKTVSTSSIQEDAPSSENSRDTCGSSMNSSTNTSNSLNGKIIVTSATSQSSGGSVEGSVDKDADEGCSDDKTTPYSSAKRKKRCALSNIKELAADMLYKSEAVANYNLQMANDSIYFEEALKGSSE